MTVVRRMTKEEQKKAEIMMLTTYMDYHLKLLYDALQEDDKDESEFQKEQLDKIRIRLCELDYFEWNKTK